MFRRKRKVSVSFALVRQSWCPANSQIIFILIASWAVVGFNKFHVRHASQSYKIENPMTAMRLLSN